MHGDNPQNTDYTVWITDHNLVPISEQVEDLSAISCTLRHNVVSSAEFTCAADPDLVAAVRTPKARAVIERDGQILIAGPIEGTPTRWGSGGHGEDDGGDLTVRFADDLLLIAGRTSYPNPAQAATAQTVAKWSRTGTPAQIAWDLVNLNAGPNALANRRVPRLIMGDLAGIGGTPTTYTSRFQPVMDELRALSTLADGRLGFRTVQVGAQILFEMYAPRDLTGSIWFSRSLGNLLSLDHEPEAPSATVAIVGGQDAGANRNIIERGDPGDWWRLEVFVDSAGASNLAELEQAGDKALVDAAEVQRLAVVAVDVDGTRYGIDYLLGDIVAVEAAPGMPDVPDIVAAVEFDWNPDDGETVKPIIGAGSADMLNPSAAEQQRILRMLSRRAVGAEIPLT
ncbi:Gp37-like protein [Melissospora conviva]|uniref:Gp37-like protein n=1 Tax=Melissospora conviva TaxID=3388432 RepID=UPI003C2653E7